MLVILLVVKPASPVQHHHVQVQVALLLLLLLLIVLMFVAVALSMMSPLLLSLRLCEWGSFQYFEMLTFFLDRDQSQKMDLVCSV